MKRLLFCFFLILRVAFAEERIKIVSITPSENTGQDYSNWLEESIDSLVPAYWEPSNFKYIDITLKLEKRSLISRLSLYDWQGQFEDTPAYLYALNGTTKTLIGTFTGKDYLIFVDLKPGEPLIADAIILAKYCNNIPQKIQVYGDVLPATDSTVKIPINIKSWYQLNNCSNGLDLLFDGKTDGKVETGWGKVLSNYDAYYPVEAGEEITVESIKMFDGEGAMKDAPLTVWAITQDWKRIKLAAFTGEEYMQWVGPDPAQVGEDRFKLPIPVKNLRYIVLNCYWGFPTEMEFYGIYKAPPATIPATVTPVKLKNAMGINAFEWDFEDPNNPLLIDEARFKAIKNFRGVRHYLDWGRLEAKEGSYTFNPAYNGGWNYDAIYQRCKKEGIEVLACIKTLPEWMINTYPEDLRDSENIPMKYGQDPANPQSYIEQAKLAFQFAGRYGSNTNVNLALLSVNSTPRWTGDSVNTAKAGMNVIRYIECENERDKWWKGRKAYQTGREYAANLSAFFDGHKGTLGPAAGVKIADPNMKVVIGGFALETTDYLRGMIDWCKEFRGYKSNGRVNLCWDIINYHYYANNTGSSQTGGATRGAAPEVSGSQKVALEFLSVAQKYCYNMPVWVTETGYDSNQGSPLKSIPIGTKTAEATRADWILRTALLYSKLGVQKCFFYQLYDESVDLTNTRQFATSGLITPGRVRKPAADFLYQTRKLLGEYTYKESLNSYPTVDRYQTASTSFYALYMPDEKGAVADYILDLGLADSAYMYKPAAGKSSMTLTKVKTAGGKLLVKVTETPVFITGKAFRATSSSSTVMYVPDEETKMEVPTPNSFSIYPNPVKDKLNITLGRAQGEAVRLRVLDLTGRVLQSGKFKELYTPGNNTVDVSFLPQGVYVVEVTQGTQKHIQKIIKE